MATGPPITGALLLIDIQRGKEWIKKRKYHLEIGATAACTKRMMETTKALGQRDIKGPKNGGCRVSSKRSAEDVMDVGADMVGMDKTHTKGLCKDTI